MGAKRRRKKRETLQVVAWGTRGRGPGPKCAESVAEVLEEFEAGLRLGDYVWCEGEVVTRTDLPDAGAVLGEEFSGVRGRLGSLSSLPADLSGGRRS